MKLVRDRAENPIISTIKDVIIVILMCAIAWMGWFIYTLDEERDLAWSYTSSYMECCEANYNALCEALGRYPHYNGTDEGPNEILRLEKRWLSRSVKE
jgi:hypothetical protein